jgi:hypothetical protein
MVDKGIFELKNISGGTPQIDELFITSSSKWLCIVYMYIKEYLMSFFVWRWSCYFEVKSFKDTPITKNQFGNVLYSRHGTLCIENNNCREAPIELMLGFIPITYLLKD